MSKKNILIVDSQGGGLGKILITKIKESGLNCIITAVGTNSIATSAMIKAGADQAATGENALIVACRKNDVIIGPMGIAIADSLYGEITAKMAKAVGKSNAVRILIPFSHCDTIFVGIEKNSLIQNAELAVNELLKLYSETSEESDSQ